MAETELQIIILSITHSAIPSQFLPFQMILAIFLQEHEIYGDFPCKLTDILHTWQGIARLHVKLAY